MQTVKFAGKPSDRDIFTQQREKRAQADFEAGGPRTMGFRLYCAVSEIERCRRGSRVVLIRGDIPYANRYFNKDNEKKQQDLPTLLGFLPGISSAGSMTYQFLS